MYGNNYRYQPMQNQYIPPMQPTTYMPPTQMSMPSLLGKIVDNIEAVKVADVSLDGSTSFFPLTDGSAIITKKLNTDGTSKTVVYKPVVEEEAPLIEFASIDDFEDLKKEIENLKSELQQLREERPHKKEGR